ncbi:hypothetical protein SOVF_090350 [Spinacia oleracea]|nr:hypothetical protein SOVF_090350 [Spinacia oleracea]
MNNLYLSHVKPLNLLGGFPGHSPNDVVRDTQLMMNLIV